jgi:hypothetical protein
LIARIPARVMMMAITQAKIGRSMKNLDIAPPQPLGSLGAVG